MARFMHAVNRKYKLKLQNYSQLHAWSVDPRDRADFWLALFEQLELKTSIPPLKAFEKVCSQRDRPRV